MDWLLFLDLVGTFVFAVSGAVAARQQHMDLMGMFVLAVVTGVGGGTLRALFVGDVPPPVFVDPRSFLIALVAVGVAWFAENRWTRNHRVVMFADAVGLGTFVAAGTLVSLDLGLPWWSCVALGTISATFGGLIRDLLSARVPLIFRGRVYASACVVGGLQLVALGALGVARAPNTLACIGVVTALRVLAERYDWHLPNPGQGSGGFTSR